MAYNHAKWMTITGAWGSSDAEHLTLSGSANWSNEAFGNDEQMQLIPVRGHRASAQQVLRQDMAPALVAFAQS